MTSNTITKAETLAARSTGWSKGRSKRDGREFYVIPSSDGRSAHYTTRDGCTCQSFYHRGECSHREAVRIVERPSTADAERARRERMRELLRND